VAPGETVYNLYWATDRQGAPAEYPGYPRRVGPPALDVAADGRLALMDPVNMRILIFDTNQGTYVSYRLPFDYEIGFDADLGFDPQGRLMVCDYQGQENPATIGPDRLCTCSARMGTW